MKRKKVNISPWYSLGLAAVLVVFSLVIATGMTWARYRTDSSADIVFEGRSPMVVYLGKVERSINAEGKEEEKFVPTNTGEWVHREDGKLQLDYAVGNGLSNKEKEFETRDQQIRVRIVSTLGLQIDEETIALKLKVPKPVEPEEEQTEDPATETPTEPPTETPTEEPSEDPTVDPQEIPPEETTEVLLDDPEKFDIYEAQAVYIRPGSPMYTTFGEGWVFRFVDEEGEELRWTLEGGELSWIEMYLVMESSIPVDTSLLQLQIDSSYLP